jgi:hypothetical protein
MLRCNFESSGVITARMSLMDMALYAAADVFCHRHNLLQ